AGGARVELVDETELLREICDGNAARDLEALRVIGDADIFVTTLLRRSRHLLDRMGAVAGGGMCVKFAPDAGYGNQGGQGSRGGAIHFVISFAKLGLDKR